MDTAPSCRHKAAIQKPPAMCLRLEWCTVPLPSPLPARHQHLSSRHSPRLTPQQSSGRHHYLENVKQAVRPRQSSSAGTGREYEKLNQKDRETLKKLQADPKKNQAAIKRSRLTSSSARRIDNLKAAEKKYQGLIDDTTRNCRSTRQLRMASHPVRSRPRRSLLPCPCHRT